VRYLAFIDGKPSAYGVIVPDLPGCTSAGRTIAEARRNAIEAVRLWIADARRSGEKLPRPRSLAELRRARLVRAPKQCFTSGFPVDT